MRAELFPDLLFSEPNPGVLLITINRPDVLNAVDESLHRQLETVWREVADDPVVRVAVITGAGKAFCAGGDIGMIERAVKDFDAASAIMSAARDLVTAMMQCEKPIISAINGPAVGAGMAVALLADISIIGETVRISDGHLRIGVAAGDHAAMLWPLLCGLAKTKYYLLTADFIDGKEAERIGLVSKCVSQDRVLEDALSVAHRLAQAPQTALRLTKRAINGWLQLAAPIFEASLSYEILTFMSDDAVEGVTALREKRKPRFGPGGPSSAEFDG